MANIIKRVFLTIFVTLAIYSVGTPLFAGSMTVGYGYATCATWNVAPKNSVDRGLVGSWVSGFLTAANYLSPEGEYLHRDDAAWIDGRLDVYCRAHPNELISTIATELYRELKERARPTSARAK